MKGRTVCLFLVVLCCVLAYEVSAGVGLQCLLPLEHGPCKALMIKYGYNPTKDRCEEFMYGGCQGNRNNFDSLESCQQVCS